MTLSVCNVDELAEGEMRRVTLPGFPPLAVYRVDGSFFVTDDMCTHGEASLTEDGELEGFQIICSWHFGKFDIRTGDFLASPCNRPLRTYPVAVEGREVILLDDSAKAAD